MATFRSSFKFDTVIVIDSLPSAEDPQTGIWLRDIILQPLVREQGFGLAYHRVDDRAALFSVLASIESVVRNAGWAPILHIESHGVPDGIVLADGDIVAWRAIKPLLTEINRACRMNLLAVMSMCHGGHLISQLQLVEPAPVWALIGTGHEVYPCRLQEAFHSFYTELLSALDGRAAVQAMNARHAEAKWDLTFDTAESWFCQIWREYERVRCTPEELQEREDKLVVQIMRQFNYDLRHALQARAVAKDLLSDNKTLFARFRRSFLMLDSFPENEERFQIRYQDCARANKALHRTEYLPQ